jgi:hypothetical protein
MSALVSFAHGDVQPLMVLGAGVATGLAAYVALPAEKKSLELIPIVEHR